MEYQELVRGAIMALSVVVLPMVSGPAQAAEPPAGAPEADCSCAAAFERVAERTETGYVAFSIKVDAERREAYDRFKTILRKDAAGAGVERCLEVLKTYVQFFQDHHLFVFSKVNPPKRTAARSWTEAEARAEIDPFQYREDNLILASLDNLQWLEEARKGMSDADGAAFDPALRRMRENPGKLVPYMEAASYTPPVLSPGPRRVVLLTDRGVGSAAEAMILDARESPRVTVVGENTRGNIDYQNAFASWLGCGDHAYALGVPRFTRTRQLSLGGLDVIGITPDIPVSVQRVDPLAFALRLLAAGNP
jgi:hypothetical protein